MQYSRGWADLSAFLRDGELAAKWPDPQQFVDMLASLETAALGGLRLEQERARNPDLKDINLEFIHLDMWRRINAVRVEYFPGYQPSPWTKAHD